MSPGDLTNRMARCAAFRAYTLGKLSVLAIETQRARRVLEREKATLLPKVATASKWETEQALLKYPRFCSAQDELDAAEGARGMMEAIAESLKELSYVLSRELTRREMETRT